MIDNSGTMGMPPNEEGTTGYRMEKTKQLLADFIGKLPDKTITQLSTYQAGGVLGNQMYTVGRASILQAMGEMEAWEGTPIVKALETAYENVIAVPTSKRVIVFLSDCGLEDSGHGFGSDDYYNILEKIKNKDIYPLIGMGVDTPQWQERFAEAAELTNGEYVVSESTADMMAAEALLKKVAQPGGNNVTEISVDLSCKTDQGELVTYQTQASTEDFAPVQKKGTPVEPGYIKIETAIKLDTSARSETAPQKSAGLPGSDSILYGNVQIGKTMSNKAMEMTVHSVSYYDKLLGLEASYNNYRFAMYEVELKNATAEKIPYLVPSIFNHFCAGIDGGLFPASSATWLMEKSVTAHGDPSVEITAGGTVAGTLAFLVPYSYEGYNQQSLHFFDTDYGHIQMPITGGALDKWAEMEKLPKESAGKLSDTFSMSVTASEVKQASTSTGRGQARRFR